MISKKDAEFYLSSNFNSGTMDTQATRNALISIAEELLRFQYETKEQQQTKNQSDNIFEKLDICAAKIKTKNRQLNKLKGNLKIACTVAKIVLSAKDREMESLINHLNMVRNESSNLLQKNHQYMAVIEKLRAENFNIYNDVEHVRNFIHLGYQELLKMRHEMPKDVSLTSELKEILIACGQYYADYCNEREKRAQFEQRNKFLKTKIGLLENNLAAAEEELRSLRSQKVRLARSTKNIETKNINRTLPRKERNLKIVAPNGELSCEHLSSATPRLVQDRSRALTSKSQLNITSHLAAIDNLLHDQNIMLKDLKTLSEELKVTQS